VTHFFGITSSSRIIRYGIPAAVIWYLVMCAAHFFNLRPLWNDEMCVFRSIQNFKLADFYSEQLLSVQMFPRTHLLVIQQFAKHFGYHLMSLRFFSFVSMLTAFFLWLRIARRVMPSELERLTLIICWCASSLMIYYSSELKPYAFDVLAGSICTWFLMHQDAWQVKTRRKGLLLRLALLPMLGLFSYTSFLFMPVIFYNLCLGWRRDRSLAGGIGLFVALILAVAAQLYLFDLRYQPEVLHTPEGYHDYFILYNSPAEFVKRLGEGTKGLFSKYFVIRPRFFNYISMAFAVPAFIYMFITFFRSFRRGRSVNSPDIIALLVYAELVLMSSLQLYPFTVPRLSLIYAPFVLYLTVQAIFAMRSIHPWLFYGYYAAFLAYLFVCATGLAKMILFGEGLGILPHIWT